VKRQRSRSPGVASPVDDPHQVVSYALKPPEVPLSKGDAEPKCELLSLAATSVLGVREQSPLGERLTFSSKPRFLKHRVQFCRHVAGFRGQRLEVK
jgi:hypothetical protein